MQKNTKKTTKKPSPYKGTAKKQPVHKGRTASDKVPPARTSDGRVPQGRTLSTHDNYLSGKKTGSTKERPVVVIEANEKNDLAVVPLSSRDGNDRTRMKGYQQGQSYFKHYVEIQDDEGRPIRVNEKFKENYPKLDVSKLDVIRITDTVLNHSKPAPENQKKMNKFRGNKKSPRN